MKDPMEEARARTKNEIRVYNEGYEAGLKDNDKKGEAFRTGYLKGIKEGQIKK